VEAGSAFSYAMAIDQKYPWPGAEYPIRIRIRDAAAMRGECFGKRLRKIAKGSTAALRRIAPTRHLNSPGLLSTSVPPDSCETDSASRREHASDPISAGRLKFRFDVVTPPRNISLCICYIGYRFVIDGDSFCAISTIPSGVEHVVTSVEGAGDVEPVTRKKASSGQTANERCGCRAGR